MTDSPLVVAGAVAGGVALLTFVVVHAIWIVPIWGMLAMLPVAGLVGAIAAWPVQEMSTRGALPPSPWDGIAFAVILLATLAPTAVLGVLTGPIDRNDINVGLLLVALALAAPAGAAVGLVLTGSISGALALGVAALVLALTLGHNLPFFPIGSPGWEKAFPLVLVAELSAGLGFSVSRALAVGSGIAEQFR